MKKIVILLILALAFTLAACTANEVEEEKLDEIKNETVTPNKTDVKTQEEALEMPWIGEPVETPIIPPSLMDETEVPTEDVTTPSQEPTVTPEVNELPISQIVPEENETPAIPIN